MRPILICGSCLLVVAACAGEDRDTIGYHGDAWRAWVDTEVVAITQVGEEETFGTIGQVALVPGAIVVADPMNHRLHLVDAAGELVAGFGREGSGPQEFRELTSLAVDGSGRLYVMDATNRRFTRYRMVDDGFEVDEEIGIPVSGRSFCLVEDRLVVGGFANGTFVHEVSLEGDVLQSFDLAHDKPALLSAVYGMGGIVCAEGGDTAYFVSGPFGEVWSVSLNGEQQWTTRLPGYRARRFEVSGNMFRPLAPQEGLHHDLVTVLQLGPDALLVQAGLVHIDDGPQRTDSWVLSMMDGAVLMTGPQMPRVLAVDQGMRVVAEEDPIPRLRLEYLADW